MAEQHVIYIKREEDDDNNDCDDDDDKENLKKKIQYLQAENATLKKALEQMQRLQGKCCDWCEVLMPNTERDQNVVSKWLEGVMAAMKSQRQEEEEEEERGRGGGGGMEAEEVENIVMEEMSSSYVPSQLMSQMPRAVVPSPPTAAPIAMNPRPLTPSNPDLNLQPVVFEGTAMMKPLPINPMKLKAILRATTERRPGDKLKYLLNKLVDALFTRDELVAASGLGLRMQKDKQQTPLDRKKLNAIKEFLGEFSMKKNMKMMDARTFRVTVGNKITNARRNLRNEFRADQVVAAATAFNTTS
ncbi:proline-rich protein 11-like [Argonauta hians]